MQSWQNFALHLHPGRSRNGGEIGGLPAEFARLFGADIEVEVVPFRVFELLGYQG